MALINTARALDDARFLWRVRAAQLELAAAKIRANNITGSTRLYAEHILANPMAADPRMEALVATNDAVAEAIVVDEYNTVNTEGVTDAQITSAANTYFATVAELMFNPTVMSDPETN